MSHPTPATDPATTTSDLRAAAGEGYTGEWALFCDYTTATDQPALPTTLEALTGFLADVLAAPATRARRIRAIASAHRRAGHLLERPVLDAAPHTAVSPAVYGANRSRQRDTGPAKGGEEAGAGADPGQLLAACPPRGWPAGLWGRRDAFLIVLTAHLGHAHNAARAITTADIDFRTQDDGQARVVVADVVVPDDVDARTCASCAVVRWLEVLGDLDGLGRGSARLALTEAHAPTAESHQHSPTRPARWRGAVQLLPAIDRHGWHDDYRPMTARALRGRLALARARAARNALGHPGDPQAMRDPGPTSPRAVRASPGAGDLAAVLGALDALADDADALNARIQTLLEADQRSGATAGGTVRGR